MTQPLNNFATQQPTAPAVGGIGGALSGQKNTVPEGQQGDFEKYIASLKEGSATGNASQTTETASSLSGSDAPLSVEAILQAANALEEGSDSVDPIAALIESLTAKINGVLAPTVQTGSLTPAQIEELKVVGEALAALLGQLEQASAGKPTETGTKISSQSLDQLNKLVESITQLQKTSPQLAEIDAPELDALLDRAQKLIQGPTTAPVTSNTTTDAEANNVVALLFGENGAKKTSTTSLSQDLQTHLLNNNGQSTKTSLNDLPEPLGTATLSKNSDTLSLGEQAQTSVIGRVGNAAPTATAAAMANGIGSTGSGTDEVAQDPLILAQSQAVNGQKNDFAAQLRATSVTYNTPTPNMNMPHIAVAIAKNVAMGNSRFQVRLDPPEMGKIDVAMDIDKSGALTARISVERAETLDLLQRDSKALERALAQSGLDSSKTNLEFSLKQNPFNQPNQQDQDDTGFEQFADQDDDAMVQVDATTARMAQLYQGNTSPGGVNIWA